jgi:hypothetical protein
MAIARTWPLYVIEERCFLRDPNDTTMRNAAFSTVHAGKHYWTEFRYEETAFCNGIESLR